MRYIVSCVAVLLCVQLSAYPETIVLKSGKTIEGKIIEKSDTYIKVATSALPEGLTYYLDDVERIGSGGTFPLSDDAVVVPFPKEEQPQSASEGVAEASGVPVDQDLLPFKLGVQKVGDSVLNFEFPGTGQTLYAFNMGDWQAKPAAGETKLIVKLYDKKKQLIEKAESVCVQENVKNFGSIAFNTTKKTVDSIAFFSAAPDVCPQAGSALDESKPEVQFARVVEDAIKENKEAFFALYIKPPHKELAAIEDFMYQSLRGMLGSGGKVVSVTPMEPGAAEKLKKSCPRPYEMTIEQKAEGGSTTLTIPIGKVNDNWRILSGDEGS